MKVCHTTSATAFPPAESRTSWPFSAGISDCPVNRIGLCTTQNKAPPGSSWAPARRITQHHPAVLRRLTRHVVKRGLPERHRAIEVVAMNDDGADPHSAPPAGAYGPRAHPVGWNHPNRMCPVPL